MNGFFSRTCRNVSKSFKFSHYNKRNFGSGGGHGGPGHHEPHIPVFHDRLGKFCLVSAFVWIFYRAKENKGQLFGLYHPWLHEHEHEHFHFVESGDHGDTMPVLHNSHGEEHEDEDEDEEH
jgi:hypothetical protein